mgnify:CR=1 FL=1
MALIDDIARRYRRLSLWLIAAMAVPPLLLLGGSQYESTQLACNIVVSALFSLVTMVAYGAAWHSLAKSSPTALAKFYLAAPILRMLAAVAVMLVFYAVHRNDVSPHGTEPAIRGLMLGFTAVFFAFYFVQMIFESVYFAQVEKHNKIQ